MTSAAKLWRGTQVENRGKHNIWRRQEREQDLAEEGKQAVVALNGALCLARVELIATLNTSSRGTQVDGGHTQLRTDPLVTAPCLGRRGAACVLLHNECCPIALPREKKAFYLGWTRSCKCTRTAGKCH